MAMERAAAEGQAAPTLMSLLGSYLSAHTPREAVEHAQRLCGAVEELADKGESSTATLVGFLNR